MKRLKELKLLVSNATKAADMVDANQCFSVQQRTPYLPVSLFLGSQSHHQEYNRSLVSFYRPYGNQ